MPIFFIFLRYFSIPLDFYTQTTGIPIIPVGIPILPVGTPLRLGRPTKTSFNWDPNRDYRFQRKPAARSRSELREKRDCEPWSWLGVPSSCFLMTTSCKILCIGNYKVKLRLSELLVTGEVILIVIWPLTKYLVLKFVQPKCWHTP